MIRTGTEGPEPVPLSTTRALQFAITRAADTAFGMALSVIAVAEDVLPLDDAVRALPDDGLIIALERAGDVVGCLVVDQQLRSAVIEQQTTGRIAPQSSAPRQVTGADLLLISPLISHFLKQASAEGISPCLASSLKGVGAGHRMAGPRSVGLALDDGLFRVLDLKIQLGENRQGGLVVVVPAHDQTQPVAADSAAEDWGDRFTQAVMAAPAAINAELATLSLSLAQMRQLAVGQLLPVYGANVGSVKLRAADGSQICSARLGQSMGKRAVRTSPDIGLALSELPQVPVVGPNANTAVLT